MNSAGRTVARHAAAAGRRRRAPQRDPDGRTAGTRTLRTLQPARRGGAAGGQARLQAQSALAGAGQIGPWPGADGGGLRPREIGGSGLGRAARLSRAAGAWSGFAIAIFLAT